MISLRSIPLERKKELDPIFKKAIGQSYPFLRENSCYGCRLFGAFKNDELIGFAGLKCYSGTWYLSAAWVRPDYRGKGIHSKLIRYRIALMMGETKRLRVAVHHKNRYSLHNVKKHKFKEVKRVQYESGERIILERIL